MSDLLLVFVLVVFMAGAWKIGLWFWDAVWGLSKWIVFKLTGRGDQ